MSASAAPPDSLDFKTIYNDLCVAMRASPQDLQESEARSGFIRSKLGGTGAAMQVWRVRMATHCHDELGKTYVDMCTTNSSKSI